MLATVSVLTHGRTVGLVLAIVATASVAIALPGGWWWRFAFTAGWEAVLAYALVPRDAGGYLIGADTRGYVLLGLGMVLMLYGIVTVRPLRPPPEVDSPST